MKEEFVEWEGHPKYLISSKGYVLSKLSGKIIAPDVNSAGYFRVTANDHGKRDRQFLHRLVAKAFLPNPENLPQVNHKDGDKQNNAVENLEWCSMSDNMKHRYVELNCKIWNSRAVVMIDKDGHEIARFESCQQAGREMGLNPHNIDSVAANRKWRKSCGGFFWWFADELDD